MSFDRETKSEFLMEAISLSNVSMRSHKNLVQFRVTSKFQLYKTKTATTTTVKPIKPKNTLVFVKYVEDVFSITLKC